MILIYFKQQSCPPFILHMLLVEGVTGIQVLVTGGLGYIGSHVCVALIEAGHQPILADNLKNSSVEILHQLHSLLPDVNILFEEVDFRQQDTVERLFMKYRFDAVIHLAGIKSVAESIHDPLEYYHTNVLTTLHVAEAVTNFKVPKLIFSSSATVYGDASPPLVETLPIPLPLNPYGATKAMCERILQDVSFANPELSVIALRYFNPVGAHESGLIGERVSESTQNLMPHLLKAARNEKDAIKIFGNDYPTPDGSCIRDFIHVMDLAEAHVVATEMAQPGFTIYNLGTGKGTSVFELIHAFEETNDLSVKKEIQGRRKGDHPISFADSTKAQRDLGWRAKRTINDMCRDAWNYAQRQNETYSDF